MTGKDSAIMPVAFQHAALGLPDNEMRHACTAMLDRTKALLFMFDAIQNLTGAFS